MIKLRRVRWALHVACMGRWEIVAEFWLASLKGTYRFCKTKALIRYNIKKDLKEIGWDVADLINVDQDGNLGSIKRREFLEQLRVLFSFSMRLGSTKLVNLWRKGKWFLDIKLTFDKQLMFSSYFRSAVYEHNHNMNLRPLSNKD